MSDHQRTTRRIEVPTEHDAERAMADARRLFRRTLASWASDLLLMRRSGVTRPAWPAGTVKLDRAA